MYNLLILIAIYHLVFMAAGSYSPLLSGTNPVDPTGHT